MEGNKQKEQRSLLFLLNTKKKHSHKDLPETVFLWIVFNQINISNDFFLFSIFKIWNHETEIKGSSRSRYMIFELQCLHNEFVIFSLCWSKCLCLRYKYCQWLKCNNKSFMCLRTTCSKPLQKTSLFANLKKNRGKDGNLEQKNRSQSFIIRSGKNPMWLVVVVFLLRQHIVWCLISLLYWISFLKLVLHRIVFIRQYSYSLSREYTEIFTLIHIRNMLRLLN